MTLEAIRQAFYTRVKLQDVPDRPMAVFNGSLSNRCLRVLVIVAMMRGRTHHMQQKEAFIAIQEARIHTSGEVLSADRTTRSHSNR